MVGMIPSATNKDDKGISSWEKTQKDVNNVDENFKNARDLGYTRLNYSRLTGVGKLAKYDSVDTYKVQVQSNGKLGISLRNTNGSDDKVLDLSEYEKKLDELKQITDPEGWKAEQDKKQEELENKDYLAINAPGMKMEVYMVKNGREVLVGDSTADRGTKLRDDLDNMLKGDYKASKGDYYIKISRDDTVDSNEETPYALQVQQGKTYKHDYIMKEQISDDTKNKKLSTIPSINSDGVLSSVNALQIQASKHQATAQMLQVGYMNMADIYSRNSKF